MSDVLMLISSLRAQDGMPPFGNVIDIEGNSTNEKTALDAFTPKVSAGRLEGTTTFAGNQTWEIATDPGGSSHHIIKNPATNFCIDIRGAVQTPGAILQTYQVKSSDNANQLWDFLPDPFGSGASFIQNPETGLVIEIKGASDQAGSALVLGRRRLFDNDHQLWSGLAPSPGDSDGTELARASLPTLTLEAAPSPFGGHGQYALLAPDQNDPFTSLRVTLDVIEDLVIDAFTLQINGDAPAPPQNPNKPVSSTNDAGSVWDAQWLQYWLEWNGNHLALGNQFWHRTGTESSSPFPSVPGHVKLTGSGLSFEHNTIPAGTQIVLELTIDGTAGNRVTAITASVYQNSVQIGSGTLPGPGQKSFQAGFRNVEESDLAPFGAFQVVVAGDPDAGTDNSFSAGMGTITISCQPACTVTTGPGGVDPLFGLETAENTNCYYGQVQTGSFEHLVQPFGVTSPRVISISAVDSVLVGAGLYPNGGLTTTGHFTFQNTQDKVPIEVVPGLNAEADGSFAVALGFKWASQEQASANAAGGAPAICNVKVADANGNSVTAKLLTGSNAANVLSQSGSVGTFPSPPTGVTAAVVAGSQTAVSVSFTAPLSDGGMPITEYQAKAHPSNGGAKASADGTHSPIKVSGLSTGDAYTFTVTAKNKLGASTSSVKSSELTP